MMVANHPKSVIIIVPNITKKSTDSTLQVSKYKIGLLLVYSKGNMQIYSEHIHHAR